MPQPNNGDNDSTTTKLPFSAIRTRPSMDYLQMQHSGLFYVLAEKKNPSSHGRGNSSDTIKESAVRLEAIKHRTCHYSTSRSHR